MVRLIEMTEVEYQAYLESSIPRYADEQVKAGNWHPSEALERSRKDHAQLLPDGMATKDMYLLSIEDAATDAPVGMIWFGVNDKRPISTAFIYDFAISEALRRRGYATGALQALEGKVKELGVQQIELHVFGHNHAAQALYEKVGYGIAGIYMAKKVS